MRRLLEDVPLTQEERTALKEAAFDPNLHASLIDELKCMYVAVSRARNNVSGQLACVGKTNPGYSRLCTAVRLTVTCMGSHTGWLG